MAALCLLLALGFRLHLERSGHLRDRVVASVHDEVGARLVPGETRIGFWPVRVELSEPALELEGGGRLELTRARIEISPNALLAPERARVLALSLSGPARLRHPHLELTGSLELALAPVPEAESPGRWSVRGAAVLDSGGSLDLAGSIGPDGSFEGRLDLAAVEATPFAQLLAGSSREREPPRAHGLHSGSFELPADGSGIATLHLASDDSTLRVASIALSGPISLVAEIPISASASSSSPSSSSAARGRFEVDASRARVEYADGLARAAGSGATLRGRIGRTDEGRLLLDELALEVERFEGGAIRGDRAE